MKHLVLACALLAGCGYVDPITAVRMSAISPLDADPAVIKVQPNLPDGLRMDQGDAVLSLTLQRLDTGARETENFTLAKGEAGFAIDVADHDRMRRIQDLGRTWKLQAPDATQGSLSLSLTGCSIGNGPAYDETIDVDIVLTHGGSALPLLEGLPVYKLLDEADLRALPTCETRDVAPD